MFFWLTSLFCCALMQKPNWVSTYTSEQLACICKHPEAHHKIIALWVQSSMQVCSGVTLFKEQMNTFKLTEECLLSLNLTKQTDKKKKHWWALQWNLAHEFIELTYKTLSVKPSCSIPASHNQCLRKLYWLSGILPGGELKSSPLATAFYSNLSWQ